MPNKNSQIFGEIIMIKFLIWGQIVNSTKILKQTIMELSLPGGGDVVFFVVLHSYKFN